MKTKMALLGLVLAGILFLTVRWLQLQFAYTQIEQLTQQHSTELSTGVEACITSADNNTQKAPGLIAETSIEYFKVFEYSTTNAKTFVVTQDTIEKPGLLKLNDGYGTFCYLIFRDGIWIPDPQKPPEVVWSRAGSAHGETWPPYH